ncbi:methyltransferase RsmF C-terminal domain-like protein [Xanthocytophaga flavus]
MLTSNHLPEVFLSRMQATLGSEYVSFVSALEKEPPVSIRLNPQKGLHSPATYSAVPWAERGLYIPQRPVFALDPRWHAGAYYVQEASSMFLEQAWKTIAGSLDAKPVVLDLCAAPGGKSTHLASLLPQGSLLVSNEVIRSRAQILTENSTKWGRGNIIVTNSDPQDFGDLESFFDVIVIDAPCSGEGMFRKDPDAVKEWSEANVHLCAERQHRILADVWNALKPDGFLIYSTCTYNANENEQVLQWLTENYEVKGVEVVVPDQWNITVSSTRDINGYRFYPHRTEGEGLFMAVLQKTEGQERSFRKPKKPTWLKAPRKEVEIVSGWIQERDDWEWLRWQEKMVILPAGMYDHAEQLAQHTRIVYAGVDVAEIIRDQANPLPALALFDDMNPRHFAVEEVDLEKALRFLKKEDIALETGKGWKLIVYQNIPLGWVKQIGHRANNYFPNEWRLRMDWREVEKLLTEPITFLEV